MNGEHGRIYANRCNIQCDSPHFNINSCSAQLVFLFDNILCYCTHGLWIEMVFIYFFSLVYWDTQIYARSHSLAHICMFFRFRFVAICYDMFESFAQSSRPSTYNANNLTKANNDDVTFSFPYLWPNYWFSQRIIAIFLYTSYRCLLSWEIRCQRDICFLMIFFVVAFSNCFVLCQYKRVPLHSQYTAIRLTRLEIKLAPPEIGAKKSNRQ